MAVTDFVVSSIEKTVESTSNIHLYWSFTRNVFGHNWCANLATRRCFAKEPIRRMILAMSSNTASLGTNRTNTFHQKFQLNEIIVYRNGPTIAGTTMSTTDKKRMYHNTLEALDFVFDNSLGICLDNYHYHYIMAFDLTSTQESSHVLIHPELTICTISVDLSLIHR